MCAASYTVQHYKWTAVLLTQQVGLSGGRVCFEASDVKAKIKQLLLFYPNAPRQT